MRTVTTYSTRQLATAIANTEAREATTAAIPHLVQATEAEVNLVKERLDEIVDEFNRHPSRNGRQLEKAALSSDTSLAVQDRYVELRPSYSTPEPVQL